MQISRLKISNFRSIDDLDISISDLTTVIGRNNAGKSNLLRSIDALLTASDRSLREMDICLFATGNQETFIECEFQRLSDSEKDTFSKYIDANGRLTIRRVIEMVEGKIKSKLHGWIESPDKEWLREDFSDYGRISTWNELEIDFFSYLPDKDGGRISKADFITFIGNYVDRNRADLTFQRILSPTELLGRQSTAIAALPAVTFVPAVGDISKEIVGSSTSLLNIIAEEIIANASESDEFVRATEAIAESTSLINRGERRLQIFDQLEAKLSEQLQGWGAIDCVLHTQAPDLAKVLLANLALEINDGAFTDVRQKGHGIQRQILFQLFRMLASLRKREGIFQDIPLKENYSRSHIILFEEPELFLHPQAQEQFLDDLVSVSKAYSDQVLLATHSSHLLRLEYVHSIVILRRETPQSPTKHYKATEDWVSDRTERDQLKEVSLLSTGAGKMFFADKIVLVEGHADYVYLVGVRKKWAALIGGLLLFLRVVKTPCPFYNAS